MIKWCSTCFFNKFEEKKLSRPASLEQHLQEQLIFPDWKLLNVSLFIWLSNTVIRKANSVKNTLVYKYVILQLWLFKVPFNTHYNQPGLPSTTYHDECDWCIVFWKYNAWLKWSWIRYYQPVNLPSFTRQITSCRILCSASYCIIYLSESEYLFPLAMNLL